MSSKEDKRLAISLGIVATCVAVLALDFPRSAPLLIGFALVALLASATASAIYLVLSAATLKYDRKERDSIGLVPFTEKFRRGCFDYSVNIFGTFFMIALIVGIDQLLRKLQLGGAHTFIYACLILTCIFILYLGFFYRRKSKDRAGA